MKIYQSSYVDLCFELVVLDSPLQESRKIISDSKIYSRLHVNLQALSQTTDEKYSLWYLHKSNIYIHCKFFDRPTLFFP